MKNVGSARSISLQKKLLLIIMAFIMVIASLTGAIGLARYVRAAEGTEAALLGVDRQTQGNWYSWDKTIDDYTKYEEFDMDEFRSEATFVYGTDGFSIPLYTIYGDGQPITDLTQLSDYSDGSPVNPTVYPDYVENISLEILSTNDSPDGYYDYKDEYRPGSYPDGRALKIFPYTDNTGAKKMITLKNIMIMSTGEKAVNVSLKDDEWHMFTFYGYKWSTTGNNAEKFDASIANPVTGETLATYTLTNYYQDSFYVSFAVKGDFTLKLTPHQGSTGVAIAGMFFDPMLPETEAAEYAKELSAPVCESPKTVKLSWTNGINKPIP